MAPKRRTRPTQPKPPSRNYSNVSTRPNGQQYVRKGSFYYRILPSGRLSTKPQRFRTGRLARNEGFVYQRSKKRILPRQDAQTAVAARSRIRVVELVSRDNQGFARLEHTWNGLPSTSDIMRWADRMNQRDSAEKEFQLVFESDYVIAPRGGYYKTYDRVIVGGQLETRLSTGSSYMKYDDFVEIVTASNDVTEVDLNMGILRTRYLRDDPPIDRDDWKRTLLFMRYMK